MASQIPGPGEGIMPAQQQSDISIAHVCQMGQDFVQDIVQKASEVFINLKVMQLPNGTQPSLKNTQDRANKIRESLGQIDFLFRNLKVLYKECQKKLPDDIDPRILVPYQNTRLEVDESSTIELPMQKSSKELILEMKKAELESILRSKNQQLAVLVEQMRNLVWEINSVISLEDCV